MEVMPIGYSNQKFAGLDVRREETTRGFSVGDPTSINCRAHLQNDHRVHPNVKECVFHHSFGHPTSTKSRSDERVVSRLVPPCANKKKSRKQEKKPFEEKVILSSL